MSAIKWIAAGVAAVATVFLFVRRAKAPEMPKCREQWAIHHGGKRDMNNVRVIVLHSTEGNTAAGAAGWFQNPASAGSAHVVVDDDECVRTLPDDVVPWGAKGVNEDGLHLEMAGHALDDPKTGAKAFTRDDWIAHRATLVAGAGVVANWAKLYDIPLKFIDAEALKNGERGITTHLEVTRAYSGGVGHVDPGSEFPLDTFMDLVGGNLPPEYIA